MNNSLPKNSIIAQMNIKIKIKKIENGKKKSYLFVDVS